LVGVETAKTLSFAFNKPIIPVNHIIAHSYGNFITIYKGKNVKESQPKFPAINLIVSGGHTELTLIKDHNNFKFLGGTRDDAAGEAFDKISRILGLSYPGGPSISKAADKYLDVNLNPKLDLFPRPMKESKDFDFSFSGLKTSVKNYFKQNEKVNIEKIAAEVQEAIVDSLVEKTIKACKKFKPESLFLSGGVAANKRLRKKLSQRSNIENPSIVFHVPDVVLCTDNAVITASRAYFNQNIISWKKLEANPQLSLRDL
jgi:N6-L-threonylcarbamoyladenine synthase